MASKEINVKLQIDHERLTELFRRMDETLSGLQAVQRVRYDENTLTKVRCALEKVIDGVAPSRRDDLVTDCITEMQNKGILFRERP